MIVSTGGRGRETMRRCGARTSPIPTSSTTPPTRPASVSAWTASARRFGAEVTGASLYHLPPGEALCPYHYEYGEEEWMLVVAGTADGQDARGHAARSARL